MRAITVTLLIMFLVAGPALAAQYDTSESAKRPASVEAAAEQATPLAEGQSVRTKSYRLTADYIQGKKSGDLRSRAVACEVSDREEVNGEFHLELTKRGESRVQCRFGYRKVSGHAGVRLELLHKAPVPGQCPIDVIVNDRAVVQDWSADRSEWHVTAWDLSRYLIEGENRVEVRLGEAPKMYWLKRIELSGAADCLSRDAGPGPGNEWKRLFEDARRDFARGTDHANAGQIARAREVFERALSSAERVAADAPDQRLRRQARQLCKRIRRELDALGGGGSNPDEDFALERIQQAAPILRDTSHAQDERVATIGRLLKYAEAGPLARDAAAQAIGQVTAHKQHADRVVIAAIDALGRLSCPRAARALQPLFHTTDFSQDFRVRALTALRNAYSHEAREEALACVAKVLDRKLHAERVCLAAVQTLDAVGQGSPTAVEILRIVFRSNHLEDGVNRACLQSLRSAAPDAVTVAEILAPVFRTTDYSQVLRSAAADTLGQTNDPNAARVGLDALRQVLVNKIHAENVTNRVLAAIDRLGPMAPRDAVETLATILKTTDFPQEQRIKAIRTIGTVGHSCRREAIRVLDGVVQSTIHAERVRRAAREALDVLEGF